MKQTKEHTFICEKNDAYKEEPQAGVGERSEAGTCYHKRKTPCMSDPEDHAMQPDVEVQPCHAARC